MDSISERCDRSLGEFVDAVLDGRFPESGADSALRASEACLATIDAGSRSGRF